MKMKTFKWHDAWKETPVTNDGISELLVVNYEVNGKDSKTGKCYYEYALCVYNEAEQCFTVIGNNLLNVPENKICIDWKDINQWSYIPYTEDVNQLKYRINKIAKFIDGLGSNGCWDCPLRNKCFFDAGWDDLDCKEIIVKYLSGGD